MKKIVEYVWIGGGGELRAKSRVIGRDVHPMSWGFDGSSTGQSSAESSDLILEPVRVIKDPIRGFPNQIAMCQVLTQSMEPVETNHRAELSSLANKTDKIEPLFGMEQEYTLYFSHAGNTPAGIFATKKVPEQGQFYCAIGSDNIVGRILADSHLEACIDAGLNISGINAEVMPGQWEFQIGPCSAKDVGDEIWLARYLLERLAESYDYRISYAAKPHPELNGAGMHTNFSTKAMREDDGLYHCARAAESLGLKVISDRKCGVEEGKKYRTDSFPEEYGTGYKERLTGECETCSYEEFKIGESDRTASIRIPAHVVKAGKGYIEDRRPCADADPYRVATYILSSVA